MTSPTHAPVPERTHQDVIFSVHGLSHAYGTHRVLERVDVEINAGEFMCIVGPSGVGKSTLLQCLSGLRKPTTGELVFQGTAIDGPPEGMAVVFQDYSRSLMPWLDVRANVTLPLRSAGVSRTERAERAQAALDEVGLSGFEHHYPWQLSGGMQQRVAIARALAFRPALIVMDEPFASVDAQTRADLEDLTLQVRKHLGITFLLVTHDIDEAVYLSDRVLVLNQKPAVVVDVIDVPLDRDRDQITTKSRPEFAEARSRVYELIRGHQA